MEEREGPGFVMYEAECPAQSGCNQGAEWIARKSVRGSISGQQWIADQREITQNPTIGGVGFTVLSFYSQ